MTNPSYERLKQSLSAEPKRWLITGVAGFIGSHLLESLLQLNQEVVGIDNFVTGRKENLTLVQRNLAQHNLAQHNLAQGGVSAFSRFSMVEGDICDRVLLKEICQGVDIVLHQAAMGSVPRSVENPLLTNQANVEGFVNVCFAAQSAGVKRIVFASSSSVYGDTSDPCWREDRLGKVLSPYAASKRADELYADAFSNVYDLETIGLRYFNVFGARQDPNGPYAAVVPKWIDALRKGEECHIHGDGTTSRDFCFIDNVIQVNLLAAMVKKQSALNRVYNVAVGAQTSLNELYQLLAWLVAQSTGAADHASAPIPSPVYGPFRKGDIKHSLADISLAKAELEYQPLVEVREGLRRTVEWSLKDSN